MGFNSAFKGLSKVQLENTVVEISDSTGAPDSKSIKGLLVAFSKQPSLKI